MIMKKILSALAILVFVVLATTGCGDNSSSKTNEKPLEELAQEDMVSLFKSIAMVPSSVKVNNVVPYIECDSVYCCTCHVVTDNTDGVSVNTIFDYTLVRYREEDGSFTYYNYINDLSRPNQKRQEKWYKNYFYDQRIKERSKGRFNNPDDFMMDMIYTGADIHNRSMKMDYGLE